jgi:hypothetical protein
VLIELLKKQPRASRPRISLEEHIIELGVAELHRLLAGKGADGRRGPPASLDGV